MTLAVLGCTNDLAALTVTGVPLPRMLLPVLRLLHNDTLSCC